MTIEDVQRWCRAQRVDARGIVRGGECLLRHDGEGDLASAPSLEEVLHWEVHVAGQRYPSSPSDMERLVTGRMSFEDFVKIMGPREGRRSE